MKKTLTPIIVALVTGTMFTAAPAMAQAQQTTRVSANLIEAAEDAEFLVTAEPDFGDVVRPASGGCTYIIQDGVRSLVETNQDDCAVEGSFVPGEAELTCDVGRSFIIGSPAPDTENAISAQVITGDLTGSPDPVNCEGTSQLVPLQTILIVTQEADLGFASVTVPLDIVFLD